MSAQYKVCPLFWDGCGNTRSLSNAELLEKLLNDGWKIVRVDAIPPVELPVDTLSATNVYILGKQQSEAAK